jgi:hypothetical protein
VLAAIRHAAVATSSFTAAGLAPALAWRRRARQVGARPSRERGAPARGRYVRTRDRLFHVHSTTKPTWRGPM